MIFYYLNIFQHNPHQTYNLSARNMNYIILKISLHILTFKRKDPSQATNHLIRLIICILPIIPTILSAKFKVLSISRSEKPDFKA
jgi:hypothetical protein